MPVDEPMVATASLLLLHVPPDTVLLKVLDAPTPMFTVPVIAAGVWLTVTGMVVKQPEPIT
jgi:hypothetical protein